MAAYPFRGMTFPGGMGRTLMGRLCEGARRIPLQEDDVKGRTKKECVPAELKRWVKDGLKMNMKNKRREERGAASGTDMRLIGIVWPFRGMVSPTRGR
nr:hypothetical protein BgiMline_007060 [Biomphalaria glabrata]